MGIIIEDKDWRFVMFVLGKVLWERNGMIFWRNESTSFSSDSFFLCVSQPLLWRY